MSVCFSCVLYDYHVCLITRKMELVIKMTTSTTDTCRSQVGLGVACGPDVNCHDRDKNKNFILNLLISSYNALLPVDNVSHNNEQ